MDNLNFLHLSFPMKERSEWLNYFLFMDVWCNCLLCPGFKTNCNWINVVQMPTLNHCTHVIILIEHYHKSIQMLYIIRIALCLCTLIHSHLLQLLNNIATRYLTVAPLTQRCHLHWAHEFCNWVSWWRLPFPKFEDPENIRLRLLLQLEFFYRWLRLLTLISLFALV